MISDSTLARALRRIALMKFFPSNNSDALAAIGEMFQELYDADAEVETAVTNLLRNPDLAEWPGGGLFFEHLKEAVYPNGLVHRDGKWVRKDSLPWTGSNPNELYPGRAYIKAQAEAKAAREVERKAA